MDGRTANIETKDFSGRYWAGYGIVIYQTFSTVAALNAWLNAQDAYGRQICKLYDSVKGIEIAGADYLRLDADSLWTDDGKDK